MECEVELGTWRGRPHYSCDRCRIRTLDNGVLAARCEVRAPAPTPKKRESANPTAGLLGPDGDPLPEPEDGGPKHVGGGWYELPDGRRVRGYDEAMRLAAPQSHDEAF